MVRDRSKGSLCEGILARYACQKALVLLADAEVREVDESSDDTRAGFARFGRRASHDDACERAVACRGLRRYAWLNGTLLGAMWLSRART